jgi:hypothetical protein
MVFPTAPPADIGVIISAESNMTTRYRYHQATRIAAMEKTIRRWIAAPALTLGI